MEIKGNIAVAVHHNQAISSGANNIASVDVSQLANGNSMAVLANNKLCTEITNVVSRYSKVLARSSSQITVISEVAIERDRIASEQIG